MYTDSPNIERKPSTIRPFLLGLAAGILIVVMGLTVHGAYNRSMRWGALDPNTKITEIYDLLTRHSIVPIELETMLTSMYRGLLAGVGDPYTMYFDAAALAAFRERMEGSFVGIGVTVSFDEDSRTVTVIQTFRSSPAYYSGILPGDRFIEVDGEDVVGMPQHEVVSRVTGEEGTDVNLIMYRPLEEETIELTITRARVIIPSVYYTMYSLDEGEVGYIRLEGFNAETYNQFAEALSNLQEQGMEGLILDLRNNTGGRLDIVNRITDRLIPEGVILFTEDALGRRVYHRSGPDYLGLPMVILVNGRSASASEVLTGAVRDAEMATIVGETTYGKGVVQNTFSLSDGTAIQITIQEYFTPLGHTIQGVGITPDVIIEMDEEYARRLTSLEFEDDVQLQGALEVISEKF